MTRKLIRLLDERRSPRSADRAASFADRLEALEDEATRSAVAPTTLTLIRIAKETNALAERIAARPMRV